MAKRLTKAKALREFQQRASDVAVVEKYKRHAADLSTVYSFRAYPVEKAESVMVSSTLAKTLHDSELILKWARDCMGAGLISTWANPEEFFDTEQLVQFVNEFLERGDQMILASSLSKMMEIGLTYQILSTVCTAPKIFYHKNIASLLCLQNVLQSMQYQARLGIRSPFTGKRELRTIEYIEFFDPNTGMMPMHFTDVSTEEAVFSPTPWRPVSFRMDTGNEARLYMVHLHTRQVLRMISVTI